MHLETIEMEIASIFNIMLSFKFFLYLQTIYLQSCTLSSCYWLLSLFIRLWASCVALVVKNLCANVGDIREEGSIPGSRRSLGRGHDNPLQYSWLENPMNRRAYWAIVHSVPKSWTWLKQLCMHAFRLYVIRINNNYVIQLEIEIASFP